MIIPTIDLMNGKLVQLEKGEKKLIELENPLVFAEQYSKYATVQLIDLDNALGKGDNFELVKELCKIAPCRVGGGVRTVDKAVQLVKAGAKKVIIGTKANKEFLIELANAIGKEKIIVALDARNGKVTIAGWQTQTNITPVQMAKELDEYCGEFLYTCVEKEGLLMGADLETVKELQKVTKNKISLAGGINSIEEIKELDKLGVDAVTGLAVYAGKFSAEQAFIEVLDFEKQNNLIPTIIQEKNGTVLSLVYSSKESLAKTLETGKVWTCSRSRKGVFQKGATSGNVQELVEVKTDCDKDALVFMVKQKGNLPDGSGVACETGQYSCFGTEKKFDLQALYDKVLDRKKNSPEGSYTKKLFDDELLLKRKLIEESAEVITAKNKEELVWECADLLYFLFVIMANNGVSISEVEKENQRRDNEKKNTVRTVGE
ncbi:MAG: phosphoribosyl-ATP diphosphatase [archaeon]|jgi:phosphoribosyl-ATP pyrophosphohydrolase/phosphoribosyl-AMP cyclohydrolase